MIWLFLFLHLKTAAFAKETIQSNGPSPICQKKLDQWCNIPSNCLSHVSFLGPLHALDDIGNDHGSKEWRCYAEKDLNSNFSKYIGGSEYCTRDSQLRAILEKCEVNVTIVDVFSATSSMMCPRIPAIIKTNKGTLLAFTEGRHTSCSDGGPKSLAYSRSIDNGKTWLPTVFLVGNKNDKIGQPMPVFDHVTNTSIVQFINATGSGIGLSSLQIESSDDGISWNKPVDISQFLGQYKGAMNGPGNAIQLKSGRLFFGGHLGAYKKDVTWWSDDHGKTYTVNKQELMKMDEIAMVELTNGSVMLNMRNNHANPCKCRAVAISNDGGLTFGPIHYDPVLISPVCQASIVRIGDAIHFSNPASTSARVDITIKKSLDNGMTWKSSFLIWSERGPGYSNLVEGGLGVDTNVKFGGILFERQNELGHDTVSFAAYPLDF